MSSNISKTKTPPPQPLWCLRYTWMAPNAIVSTRLDRSVLQLNLFSEKFSGLLSSWVLDMKCAREVPSSALDAPFFSASMVVMQETAEATTRIFSIFRPRTLNLRNWTKHWIWFGWQDWQNIFNKLIPFLKNGSKDTHSSS